jgi:peptidoglycan/xylan/chitin deacetylase (PgdA/CDA1 family)
MKTVIVTTSWDDGHKYDLRLARMLKEHGLKATFYISPNNREFAKRDLLTLQEVKDMSSDFEIGAHTLTHPRLPTIPEDQAKKEIVESKVVLENVTGKEVSTFCYPGGAYTDVHVQFVKDAGYKYARTVARHAFGMADSYEAATSLHAYKHWSDVWKVARFAKFRPMKFLRYLEWDVLAQAMFDHVASEGGIYHIWGHSWEIDRHNDWDRLERVFRYISAHPGVKYVTNGELV